MLSIPALFACGSLFGAPIGLGIWLGLYRATRRPDQALPVKVPARR